MFSDCLLSLSTMNKPTVEVCLSPALLHLYETVGKVVVIIDIFRATSTIVAALDNGATRVVPMSSVEECVALGMCTPNSITAGERDGKIAPGLEYGNSPLEYTPEFVAGKTLLLTTTNGTKLLHMVQESDQIIIGAFSNLSAITQHLLAQNKPVILACAAWKDKINMEDSLFAGAVLSRIASQFDLYDDSSRIALAMYRDAIAKGSLIDYLRASTHYHRLSGYGLIGDMEYAAQIDTHPVVPIYNGRELVLKK